MSNQKDSGSFLNRWSARKQQSTRPEASGEVRQEAGTELDSPEPADSAEFVSAAHLQGELSRNDLMPTEPSFATAATSGHDAVEQNEGVMPVEEAQKLLTDEDMPAVDTLTASSDISGFFSKGVSAALRKTALRHVFQQPSYNIRDGLNDYDGDFTSFEPLGDIVTADMKFHAARKERARLEAERLAEEQAQLENTIPDSAEPGQDDTSSIEAEQAAEPAEELDATDHDDMPDQSPVADNNLNKPVRTIGSQPCETPNE